MKKDLDFSAIFKDFRDLDKVAEMLGYGALPSPEPLSEESPESAIERTTAPPARFSSPGESK